MSDSIDPPKPNVCPVCGAVLLDAAGGLCPRCVMEDAAQPTDVPGAAPGSVPPSLEEVTAAFPQFEIVELIGKGGMGTVWKARQPTLNRHVALKLLPASLAERDPAFAERFAREGQLLARLHHPNIVAVHDSGRAGDFFYIVMEFVDGVNLRQAMHASRFTPQQALAIVPKICDALQYAHDEGVLHRDIKPENILLDAKGRVKLVDFGIAKLIAQRESAFAGAVPPVAAGGSLTLGDATLGTPNYMAPEQIEKPAEVDNRADIYSLGVVFYELLTGELPLGKFAPPSEKSAADPRLDGIVQQALEKERDRRQQSVSEMRTQVETIAGENPGSARAPRAVSGAPAGNPPKPADEAASQIGAERAGGESPAGARAMTREARALPAAPPRFSRTATVGASWMILFFIVVPATVVHEQETHEFMRHGPFASALMCFVWFVFLIPGFIAPLGTTILGWISVSQIRHSPGKLYGIWLAIFDGLLFPLLALDYGIAYLAFAFGKGFLGWTQNYNSTQEGRLIVVSCLLWTFVDFLVVYAVCRAVKKPMVQNGGAVPSATPNHPNPKLKPTLILHAVLFALVGALFVVGIPLYLALLRSLHKDGFNVAQPHVLRLGFVGAIAALLLFPLAFGADVGLCFLARKLGGRLGLRLWSVFVAVGLVLFVAEVAASFWLPISKFVEYVNPAADRAAMTRRLTSEIDSTLRARSTRYKGLSVVVSSDLNTASVNITDLQELKGIDGENVWTDISGSLSARHTGGGSWLIQGDGMLGYITRVVPMADLMGNAAQQPPAAVLWKFGSEIERVLPFDRSFIDFQTGNILRPDLQKQGPLTPEEWDAWIKQTGADAMVEAASKLPQLNADNYPRLVALNNDSCVFVAEETADFDSVRASDAEAKLKVVSERKFYWGIAHTRPRPWWFRTKDGATGVLQILGTSDKPRGLKIRYKLILPETGATQVRSRFPHAAHISRDHHSVYVVHDDVDLHYVFYYAGDFNSKSTGSQNEQTLAWQDEGRITLPNGRTFDFHRESDAPMHVHVNQYDADLSVSRVFELRDDGTPTGEGWSVPLKVALDPPALAHLIANPGAGQLAMRDANLSFGPVIEREVKDEEAIDFDSAEQAKMPEFDAADKGFGGIGERAAAGATWMEKQKMDALFDGHSLNAFGMKVRALKNEHWDELIPSELNSSIACIDAKAPPQVLLSPAKDGPATFAFQTREGGRGILQVLALTEGGVKLRYKLLVRTSLSGPPSQLENHRLVLEAELQQARAAAARQEKFFNAGTIDGLELQRAKDKVEILEAQLTGDEVHVAEARLVVARRQLELVSALWRAGTVSSAEFETANGEIPIAEAKLREAIKKISQITQPAAAKPIGPATKAVTATGSLEAKTSGTATKWVCRTAVAEADIAAVAVGQEVSMAVDAIPKHTFQGKMAQVSKTPGAELYETVIDIADPDPGFKAGMTAKVTFIMATPAFGPVIEREVEKVIDFDSGKLPNVPAALANKRGTDPKIAEKAGLAWAESEGIDAMFERVDTQGTDGTVKSFHTLLGIGMKVEVLSNEAWAKLTAQELQQLLAGTRREASQTLKSGENKPATYAFQTREGGTGILQFIGFTDKGVKLRYKLVQGGVQPAGAASPTFESVSGAATGLITKFFPKAVMETQGDSFTARYATQEFQIHGTSKVGEFAPTARKETGPSADGFILTMERLKEPLMTQVKLPDFFDKPYWQGYANEAFDTRTGQGIYVNFTFGHRLNPDFKAAMLELLKLTGSGEAKAAEVLKPATADARPAFGPVRERVLPSGEPCRELFFQFRSGEIFIVGNGPGTSPDEAAFDYKRIDEAGGVDMSASSGEQGVHITGRGCFFTRDVEDLKWDRFTAEQAVEAVKTVSFVEGVVEPRKEDFPITYLFKTARGEVGIMEVLGTVEVKHGDWSERVMKFRYKLVQGTGTTTITPSKITLPQLNFGKETQGLQAALAVTPGEPFGLRIYLRNASDNAIAIDAANYRQEDECLLTDAEGKPVPITRVTHDINVGMGGGYHGPGQVAVFECAGLSFQSTDKAPPSAGYVAQAKPGRYTLSLKLRLPGDDVPFAPNQGVWHGELETGPVTIEVKDPATQTVAPVADAIWSSHLGKPVEITVNDLQTTRENCALSLDTGKLLPVPASITLDALSQNKMTKEPAPSVAEAWVRAQEEGLTWARNNEVDAVAFVTTKEGKVVKCGLLCPDLLVFPVENKAWTPDLADPQMLKEHFEKAMHEWGFIPRIAEVTSDGRFPETYLILDTRTHRRGVLQILGKSDNPRGVKISYRLIEGAAVKKITQIAPTAAEKPIAPAAKAVTATGSLEATTSGAATKWVCKAAVAEADITAVKVGQEVSMTVDAFPRRAFQGKVAHVSDTPVTVQNFVTYDTVIDLANPDQGFKVGMTVNVTFVLTSALPVFQMRWVLDAPSAESEQMIVVQANKDRLKETLNVQKTVLLDQTALQSVKVITDEKTGSPRIELTLTDTGKHRFAEVTREGKGKRLAIIIGGQLHSAPRIMTEILDGRADISGSFSEQEARDLAAKITESLREP